MVSHDVPNVHILSRLRADTVDKPKIWDDFNILFHTFNLLPGRFTCFSKLPPELRSMIWEYNLKGREVNVVYNVRTGRFVTTTPPPANFEVCRESRLEAMRKWKLHFSTLDYPATVRANLTLDTIQVHWDVLRLNAISKTDMVQIRYLELGGKDLLKETPDSILPEILSFRNLEVLTICSPEPDCTVPWKEHFQERNEDNVPIHWRIVVDHAVHSNGQLEAFRLHHRLGKCMRILARTSLRWGPSLRLVMTEEDGSRSQMYEWKRPLYRPAYVRRASSASF